MTKFIDKSAKTTEEAVAAALEELGLERDDVSIEILKLAKSGFLGIGSTPAVVRVTYEAPDEPEAAAAPEKEEAPAAEQKPKQEKPAEAKTGSPAQAQPVPDKPAEPKGSEDVRAETAAFLSGLLERMGVGAGIEISDREDGSLMVNLSGPGIGTVIGRRGETLDAIQHLTNYVINKGGEKRCRISVDAESYRAKREESLAALAEKMAAKVIKYKRSMALEPMNSYERHVIHTALQEYEGITTNSTGTEPNRRVVISFDKSRQPRQAADKKPQSPARPAAKTEVPAVTESKKPESREWS